MRDYVASHRVGQADQLAARASDRRGRESASFGLDPVCGFSQADFADIFLRTRSARPGEVRTDPDKMPRAMTFFDRIGVDTAACLLDKLRRDPEFLFALAAAEARDSGAFVAA